MKNLTHLTRAAGFIPLLLLTLHAHPQQVIRNFFPPSVPSYSAEAYDVVSGGYLFMTPTPGNNPENTFTIMIADSIGNLLFYLNLRDSAGNFLPQQLRDFKVFDDGSMTFGWWTNAFGDQPYVLLDSNFNYTDTLFCGMLDMDNHDIVKTPDGHFHVTCYDDSIMDISVLTTTTGQQGSTSGTTYSVSVQELDTDGETIIREWKSLEYIPITDMLDSLYFVNPNILDLTHTNAIEIDLDGNYLLSQRNLNEITKVNRITGEIMWRWGGAQNEFTYINETARFSGQHDIRVLPNGNYTMFDNGRSSTPNVARAVEFSLDTVNMTATKVWEFYNPFGADANFIGSTRRMANGNTLIGWGSANLNPGVIAAQEVQMNGTVSLDLDFPTGFSYRVIKQDLPFQLNRPSIAFNAGTQTMTADSGYSTYLWSNGETNASFDVEEVGYYQCFVNYGEGFISSNRITIPDNFDTLFVTNIDDTSATLNWSAVAGASSYVIRGAEEGSNTYITAAIAAPATSYSIQGLEHSTTYVWQVQAVVAGDTTLFSLPNTFATTFFGPPDSLLAGAITTKSVVLNWSPNPNAIGYELRGKRVIDANYINVTFPANKTQFVVTGLIPNTAYNWQVRSLFTDQMSGWSKMDTFSTLPICQPPTNLTETNITSTSVSLEWDSVVPSQGYVLGGRLAGFTSFLTFELPGQGNNSFDAVNLTPGATYEWTVVNKCGPGYLSSVPAIRSFTLPLAASEKAIGAVESEAALQPSLQLFPNPATDVVMLKLENFNLNERVSIILSDISGRIIRVNETSEQQTTLGISHIPAGIYFIQAMSSDAVDMRRIVVK